MSLLYADKEEGTAPPSAQAKVFKYPPRADAGGFGPTSTSGPAKCLHYPIPSRYSHYT